MIDFKKSYSCSCGKVHNAGIDDYFVEKGAIKKLPEYIRKYGCRKAFILCDKNTYEAAGKEVCGILKNSGIEFGKYVFESTDLKPDEFSVGSAIMHFDNSCDIVVGVGSGVINDIGKILSNTAKTPYIIVATAPSMDGYGSATSSMDLDGSKISLPSRCANVIIGDIDILKKAPKIMMISGLGDMLAKYVSICEWRIGNLILGEYYCDSVAEDVRKSLKKCIENADGIIGGDEEAVKSVFEGLVLSGVAMNYAGCSRPASGVEHYFSHIWDMRGLEFGTPVSFHGIQCAIGTYYAAKVYDRIRCIKPDRDKALKYVSEFDNGAYNDELISFLGKGANVMIALENKEGKYDTEKHKERLNNIIDRWDGILKIINEEMPSSDEIFGILEKINAPKFASDIGIDEKEVGFTFKATKDIRDKYVLSRLCWDLGIIDEITF